MAGLEFTAAEIAVILDACSKAQVSEFCLGPLQIKFQQGLSGNLDLTKTYPMYPWSAPAVTAAANAEEIALPKVELSEVDKQMLSDAHLNTLMVEDPLAFEQHLIDEQTRDGYNVEQNSRAQPTLHRS